MKLFFSLSLLTSAAAFAPLSTKISNRALYMADTEEATEAVPAAEEAEAEPDNADDDEPEPVVAVPTMEIKAPESDTAANDEKIDFSKFPGAQAPLGFWDPLNLLQDADEAVFEDFRLKELTHGRVSMLAFLGYIVTLKGYRFPGCEDVPAGFGAIGKIPADYRTGMIVTLIILGIAMQDYTDYYAEQQPELKIKNEFPGDFRNGFLDFGWKKFGEKTKARKRMIELNNGRGKKLRTSLCLRLPFLFILRTIFLLLPTLLFCNCVRDQLL